MKVYIDRDKLIDKMSERGYKKYRQMCTVEGIDYNYLMACISRRFSSLNMAWFLADCLECHIDDLVSVDWS